MVALLRNKRTLSPHLKVIAILLFVFYLNNKE